MLSALVVAAGSSQRMGFDKLLADLNGQPVAVRAVGAFERCAAVTDILVLTRAGREDEFMAMFARAGFRKVRAVLAGGTARHLTVWNGLQALAAANSDFVAVHDGARPLVTPALIDRCLARAQDVGAAAAASPVTDTLKRADAASGRVTGSVDRTDLWAMQTPQVFGAALIRRAYEAVMAKGETVTDEVSAVELLGEPVALVDAGEANFKITYPRDLELAKLALAARELGEYQR